MLVLVLNLVLPLILLGGAQQDRMARVVLLKGLAVVGSVDDTAGACRADVQEDERGRVSRDTAMEVDNVRCVVLGVGTIRIGVDDFQPRGCSLDVGQSQVRSANEALHDKSFVLGKAGDTALQGLEVLVYEFHLPVLLQQ
jgi:hypothetical protein